MNAVAGNPAITVLMTVFNGGAYLPVAVRSVLAQQCADFELLIVDDCSTDGSGDCARAMGDPRIRVHRNERNLGQTKSLNVGLRMARGRYIARLDADDEALPLWLDVMRRALESNPARPVVGSSSIIMDAAGRGKRVFRKPTAERDILLYYIYDTPTLHGSVLMDRDAVLAVGGYDEYFVVCQDYELWSKLMRLGQFVQNIPDVLVRIRVTAESVSGKSRERLVHESAITLQRNVRHMTSLDLTLEDACRLRRLFLWPWELEPEEFQRAVALFLSAYERFRTDYGVPREAVSAFAIGCLSKPYCKLAVAHLSEGNSSAARGITRAYLAMNRRSGLALALQVLTYLAGLKHVNVPQMYAWWESVRLRAGVEEWFRRQE